jgi:hypothetical protein
MTVEGRWLLGQIWLYINSTNYVYVNIDTGCVLPDSKIDYPPTASTWQEWPETEQYLHAVRQRHWPCHRRMETGIRSATRCEVVAIVGHKGLHTPDVGPPRSVSRNISKFNNHHTTVHHSSRDKKIAHAHTHYVDYVDCRGLYRPRGLSSPLLGTRPCGLIVPW